MQIHTLGVDLGKTVFHLIGLNLRLGPDYFDRPHAESLQNSLVRRLERLDNTVIPQPKGASA